ncbi:MAG: adenylyltransferase/cytidyltransferase family protein [Acidobacteria bacterium]|nr:adenylyltransferase/cytidyltransferase family protein [Acidobacteriota bacterium]
MRRRRPAPRVVLANGLFDLLHVGHVRYLRAAARLGDVLVVAINSDRSVRALRGPGRPIVPGADRARLVAAIEGVDYVVQFSSPTVAPIIRRLRPDIQCKGTDYTVASVPERQVVRAHGGRVRIAGDPKRHATTGLIAGLLRRFGAGAPGSPRPAAGAALRRG